MTVLGHKPWMYVGIWGETILGDGGAALLGGMLGILGISNLHLQSLGISMLLFLGAFQVL